MQWRRLFGAWRLGWAPNSRCSVPQTPSFVPRSKFLATPLHVYFSFHFSHIIQPQMQPRIFWALMHIGLLIAFAALGSLQRFLDLETRGFGERGKLPQWVLGRSPSRHRSWFILRRKNSFDNNYYMDF